MIRKTARLLFLLLWFINSSSYYNNNIFAQQETADLHMPEFNYTASNLKDPFEDYLIKKIAAGKLSKEKELTPEEASQPLPVFSLQGIIYGQRVSQAIIDGAVHKVGDIIQEAEIIDINKEYVTLLYYGKKYKIPTPAFTLKDAIKSGGKK